MKARSGEARLCADGECCGGGAGGGGGGGDGIAVVAVRAAAVAISRQVTANRVVVEEMKRALLACSLLQQAHESLLGPGLRF